MQQHVSHRTNALLSLTLLKVAAIIRSDTEEQQ
jgi:hypothetical protein